ncbi:hypothetical protein PtA15_14A317 [Puccinia triticina]|uniref:Chromo shadow domain-containing protein n=1 Tax=Puccinia triticina TaxID=208348 RepID=A0ABY7D1I0_9BASI|nr:uncharacterized protein PtA15_14A317 [Puccinia triticina]WAQ91433.1 hypothetical protein PtA15_14A317 [Puccinia triticina]
MYFSADPSNNPTKASMDITQLRAFTANGDLALNPSPMERQLLRGFEPSELRSYNAAVEKFMEYQRATSSVPFRLPASVDDIEGFVFWAGRVYGVRKPQEVSSKTLAEFLSGIQAWHQYHNVVYPRMLRVEVMLRASKKMDKEIEKYRLAHGVDEISKSGRKSDASAKSAKKPAKAANSDQSDDDDDQKSRKRKRLSQDKITSTIAPLRKNGTGGPTKADRDSVKNRKSVRSESEASEAESVDAEEWHAKHKKLPSWEDLIRSVRTIEKPSVNDDNASQKSREKADNVINVCLLWKNGRVSWVSNEVARDKLPQKMLDFYEDHLQFSTTEP